MNRKPTSAVLPDNNIDGASIAPRHLTAVEGYAKRIIQALAANNIKNSFSYSDEKILVDQLTELMKSEIAPLAESHRRWIFLETYKVWVTRAKSLDGTPYAWRATPNTPDLEPKAYGRTGKEAVAKLQDMMEEAEKIKNPTGPTLR